VHLRVECERAGRRDIIASLFSEIPTTNSAQAIDRELATAINRALDAAGIRPSQRSRRIGDYKLEQLLAESDFHQDWAATHATLPNLKRRVRVYNARRALAAVDRIALASAARREFESLEGIRHRSILRASDFIDSEHGPALVFEVDADAARLDHLMRLHGAALDLWQKLKLIRAVAESLQAAHRQRLYHRALSPQTLLVRHSLDSATRLEVLLFDWQIATRQLQESEGSSSSTLHVEMLSDRAAQQVYLAPEVWVAQRPNPAKLDLFGLGAVSYFILTGEPPAADRQELVEKCDQGPGLTLSTRLNGCSSELEELVQFATWPDAGDRFGAVGEFLARLEVVEEAVEEALTAPASAQESVHPLDASVGDVLAGRFRVVRRLGKGATSLALAVERLDDLSRRKRGRAFWGARCPEFIDSLLLV
jgi:serine/threonine protein kinase